MDDIVNPGAELDGRQLVERKIGQRAESLRE